MPVRFRRVRGKQETVTGVDPGSNGQHEATDLLDADELELPAEEEEVDELTDDAPAKKAPAAAASAAKGKSGAGPPDLVVEDALKDLAARMTLLTTSVDTVKESREEMDEKLGAVEERMMRLGALAEAVSSKYNPFIADNSPSEPSWKPAEAEAGAAEPLVPASPEPSLPPALAGREIHPIDPGLAPRAPAAEPPSEQPRRSELPALDVGAPKRTTNEPRATPLGDHEPILAPSSPPKASRFDDAPDAINSRLEQNMLLLEWVGLMVKRVGRAGLLDLLEYYEGLGWLDQGLKNRTLRVAVGVDAPDRIEGGHWRGDVDLHERSLVAIERLEGRNISAAQLERLKMDMQRLFGG